MATSGKPSKTVANGFCTPGEINANSIYTTEEINRRLGLGTAAIRSARRQGLTVKRIGRKAYIKGEDLLTWFDANAKKV